MASFARCASRFSVHMGRAVGGRTTAPMTTLARMPAAAAGSGMDVRRAYFGICIPQTGFRRGVSGRSLLMPVNAVAVGDKLPEVKFNYFDSEGNMQEITSGELFKGKKVIIFAVPGAFTPTCSLKHLPSFIEKADELKAKGVDTIACVAVNDAFVMDAWGKSVGAGGKVLMLADGSATFAKEIGVELDLTDKGLGVRSRRYAMLVDDQVVKLLNLEEGGAFTVSSADDILASL